MELRAFLCLAIDENAIVSASDSSVYGNQNAEDSGMVFHSDLDNTLIYSYKHEIGIHKKCVEIYQNREISYMTDVSITLLNQLRQKALFVPTTTRTVEQYQRIRLGEQPPEYALACNGGVLLVHGEKDMNWYEESRELLADCQTELRDAQKLLWTDENVNFEVRNIEELFVFTKSARPRQTIWRLQNYLAGSPLEVFSNGVKIYAVPKKLSKGEAVRRFRQKVQAGSVVAAGDSRFDISMLEEADLALAEYGLMGENIQGEHVVYLGEHGIFSDEALKYILSEGKDRC